MEIPWTTVSTHATASDALIMGSRFELRTAWRSPGFLVRALRIWRQARRSPGILGVSLRAQPVKGTFWTLSAWADRDALDSFVRIEPHRSIMREVRPWMKDSVFRFWTVPAADLVPGRLWDDARARMGAAEPEAGI